MEELEEIAEYVCDMVCGKLDDVSTEEVDTICEQCKFAQWIDKQRKNNG